MKSFVFVLLCSMMFSLTATAQEIRKVGKHTHMTTGVKLDGKAVHINLIVTKIGSEASYGFVVVSPQLFDYMEIDGVPVKLRLLEFDGSVSNSFFIVSLDQLKSLCSGRGYYTLRARNRTVEGKLLASHAKAYMELLNHDGARNKKRKPVPVSGPTL